MITEWEIINQFRSAMRERGIVPPDEIIADGLIHRCDVNAHNGKGDASYVLHLDGYPVGGFENHQDQLGWTQWHQKIDKRLTAAEEAAYRTKMSQVRQRREQEKAELHAKARTEANQIWQKAFPAPETHSYLKLKQVKAWGIRIYEEALIIPLREDGEIHSIQRIDPAGNKRFLFGGRIQGCYHSIGKPVDVLLVCEGYATGATLHEATGQAVAIAFNAGNLLAVAKTLRQKFPTIKIILCADSDVKSIGNPGITKAKAAAIAVQGLLAIPDFGEDRPAGVSDFNDLAACKGLAAVKLNVNNAQWVSISAPSICGEMAPISDGSPANDLGTPNLEIYPWLDPEPIKNELLPVEMLPPELIPEPFREFIQDVAHRMQCPIDFVAISLLTITSSVIGAGCGIRPKQADAWLVIPNLWGCIVGRPGKLKTPPVTETMGLLEALENEAKESVKKQLKEYNLEMDAYTTKRSAIKRMLMSAEKDLIAGSASKGGQTPEQLRALLATCKEPLKPIRRRFKTNDATVEKIGELLSENPRGMLIYRDELIGLLKSWDKVGHEGDRAFFLEAWNGNAPSTTDRIGRGTVDVSNVCLSILGTIQPDRLSNYLYGTVSGNNDGLVQRFQLLVYPDNPKWQLVDQQPHLKAKERAFQIIKNLSEINFLSRGAIQSETDRFPYFHFDSDAQSIFYEWLTDLEENKLTTNDHAILLEHIAKYRSLIPALALIFHLIDLADGSERKMISIENVRRACAWSDYLESHARRIYHMATDIETEAAAVLAKKIEHGQIKDRFTVRDVYRLKGILKKPDIAKLACDELVSTNWLREEVIPTAKGQKRTVVYLVNPKIKKRGNHE